MSKLVTWCAGLALAGVLAGCGPSAADRAVSGSWGQVITVPGLAALNTGTGGGSEVSALSCASPGNCAAGGSYSDRHGQQAFVAIERNGRWGQPIKITGLEDVYGNVNAGVTWVSCAPAGGCAAVGDYAQDPHGPGGFVVSEENGVWGKAVLSLADGYYSSVDSVSCTSAGNCLAGGTQADDYWSSPYQGFVAEERNGRWSNATGVPGLAALNTGGDADVLSVWCASAGNCAAGGYYADGNNYQGFVAVERHGRWGQATGVPGLEALNIKGDAQVSSVSCTSAGSCLAGGYYAEKGGTDQGFAVAERNGRWGTAIQVPGLDALNKGGKPTMVTSVSCAPAGSCVVGGFYTDRSRHRLGFVTGEDNGGWGTPIPMPGLAALNKGWAAEVSSLSCPSPGHCAAGGFYTSRTGYHQGFVTQAR
jgi:hypothetical protein